MKKVAQFIPQELTQALGFTILHSLWQGLLIALLLALSLLILNRYNAATRYRIALGALVSQLIFSGITFIYYYQSATAAGQEMANANIKTSFILNATANGNSLSWDSVLLFLQEQLPLIVSIWFLGILVMLLRFLGGLIYLKRLRLTKNIALPTAWNQKITVLSQKLGITKTVKGVESELVNSPVVIGFFKPLILLPLGTIGNLPINQVEAILAHELAHIRRNDYFINLLQCLVEVLFFYHPAIWWISDFVRVERENCCDDLAISLNNDKLGYAQALISLAEMKLQVSGFALAFAGKDGSVLGRIKRLFQQPTVKPNFREGFIAVIVLILSLTFISGAALANYTAKKAISKNNFAVLDKSTIKSLAQNISTLPILDLDSLAKKNQVVMVSNEKGKLIELYIDGQKVPTKHLSKLSSFDGVRVKKDGNKTTLNGTIHIKNSKNTIADHEVKIQPVPKISYNPSVTLGPTGELKEVVVTGIVKPVVALKKSPERLEEITLKEVKLSEPLTEVKISATKNNFNLLKSPDELEPLYILNGKPIDKAGLDNLNPSTIKQIDVLKDSYAASYGEAGKNGVILITTKEILLKEVTVIGQKMQPAAKGTRLTGKSVPDNQLTVNINGNKANLTEIPKTDLTELEKKAAEEAQLARINEEKTNLVLQELKKDNLYSNDKDYTLKITNSGMYINNVKQSEALFQKYRKYLPYPNKNIRNQTFEINGRFREK